MVLKRCAWMQLNLADKYNGVQGKPLSMINNRKLHQYNKKECKILLFQGVNFNILISCCKLHA